MLEFFKNNDSSLSILEQCRTEICEVPSSRIEKQVRRFHVHVHPPLRMYVIQSPLKTNVLKSYKKQQNAQVTVLRTLIRLPCVSSTSAGVGDVNSRNFSVVAVYRSITKNVFALCDLISPRTIATPGGA
jgi:hypothetical protein